VSDAVNRVWAAWWFKPPGSFKLAKRAITDLMARVDAPVIEALGRCPEERVERLVAKAAAFAATRRRRWLHKWIEEDEGWREDDAQPFAPKEERPTRPAAAAGKKKSKTKGKRAKPEPERTYAPAITPDEAAMIRARAAGYTPGRPVKTPKGPGKIHEAVQAYRDSFTVQVRLSEIESAYFTPDKLTFEDVQQH
jgi:hypothetical protein